MKGQFEAVLTGSDNAVDGIVTPLDPGSYISAYEFRSIDNTLHLVIALDSRGKWHRINGTQPYLSGWVDELVEQISAFKH
jgi:hypothetical protein